MNRIIDFTCTSSPRRHSQRQLSKTCRESSFGSTSSTSSCESPSSHRTRSSYISNSIHALNSYHSRASTTSPVESINSLESWPGKVKGPIMKLVMKTPTLEMIQPSSSPKNMSFPNSPPQSPNNLSSDVLFTFIPNEDTPPRNSAIPNSFNLTSVNGLRKQKMDRLRRKLGQDVPFDLVFPTDTDTESEPSTPDLSPDVNQTCGVLPLPIPRVRKPLGRISTARDSIVESASVHHAKRHVQPSSISRPTVTHARVRSASSEPEQITPTLSFIIESPDEHGMGCSEEFGHSPKPGNNTKFKSEWTVSTGEAKVKVWNTRKGYEGWHSKSPPTTQMPPTPPPSPPPTNTQPQSKKKPSSYRKPVPPIPIDCY